MPRFICFILFLAISHGPVYGKNIIDLLSEGKIDEARREIERVSSATRRDGTILYYQALIEEDGAKAFDFLKAAFKAEMSTEFLEDNIYRQVLYNLAAGDYEKMGGTATGYLQYWEKGKYRAEILRLAALAFEKQNKPKKAEQYRRQLIRENEDQSPGIIGRLDEARQLYYDRKYIDAQKICRRLGNSKLDEAAAGALYMLSFYSLEQKRVDDAILYYNLLRERYPVAVGLNALVNGLSQIERGTTDRRAEKITGTVYSVKVGVFSKKDNAKKMAKRMEKFGEKVEIKQKPISDKKYHVVYVGRFQSMEKAMAFKARLESSENEAYQVVAR